VGPDVPDGGFDFGDLGAQMAPGAGGEPSMVNLSAGPVDEGAGAGAGAGADAAAAPAAPAARAQRKRKLEKQEATVELPSSAIARQLEDASELVVERPTVSLTKRARIAERIATEDLVAGVSELLALCAPELVSALQGLMTGEAAGKAGPAEESLVEEVRLEEIAGGPDAGFDLPPFESGPDMAPRPAGSMMADESAAAAAPMESAIFSQSDVQPPAGADAEGEAAAAAAAAASLARSALRRDDDLSRRHTKLQRRAAICGVHDGKRRRAAVEQAARSASRLRVEAQRPELCETRPAAAFLGHPLRAHAAAHVVDRGRERVAAHALDLDERAARRGAVPVHGAAPLGRVPHSANGTRVEARAAQLQFDRLGHGLVARVAARRRGVGQPRVLAKEPAQHAAKLVAGVAGRCGRGRGRVFLARAFFPQQPAEEALALAGARRVAAAAAAAAAAAR
jgi:hypothetical protein